ncbi:MAG: alpha-2-macroglobulin [Desulfobacteraceae bacterium]|nr:alpha-2-macroglobulin [Desulfobacteraceae bacterium]
MASRIFDKLIICCILSLLLLCPLAAGAEPSPPGLHRPPGAHIVPDAFLRRWDPVTLFFDQDTGPKQGGAEDFPDKYVDLDPTHPGAYTWLNARTLQFRPAEPWPAMAGFVWTVGNREHRLFTLMSVPTNTIPTNVETGLPPVDAITLSFPEPIDPGVLSRMVSIRLRPLPGGDDTDAVVLDHRHFTVKVMERRNRNDPAGYVLALKERIGPGTKVLVNLKLSLADDGAEAFHTITFSTARPFHITHCGCGGQTYPIPTQRTDYSREQALECPAENRTVEIWFSSPVTDPSPTGLRNLVRFSPVVENLRYTLESNVLYVQGDFVADTLYQVSLFPADITDRAGRPLSMTVPASLFLYYPATEGFLQWKTSQGILERFGPKMVPLKGRGFQRADLRIYKVDPLDRSFWPFPNHPVAVDEDRQPFAPGEEPVPFSRPDRYISADALSGQIKSLGSPALSQLIPIPLRRSGSTASFGLDLSPHFQLLDGKDAPGTYLVGIRILDGSTSREWIRVQSTDLSLSTFEESRAVKFAVTSIATGRPVKNARVLVEGSERKGGSNRWSVFADGNTDNTGIFTWPLTNDDARRLQRNVRRIRVQKGGDHLVLDPTRPPEAFARSHWEARQETWLQWTLHELAPVEETERLICHLFTERPVYRPDEPVHLKGYFRRYSAAKLSPVAGKGFLVVRSSGDMEWRYPVTITEYGSFYHQFDEPKLPTGEFYAYLEYKGISYGPVSFSKEAYRLPKFEVQLHGPDRVRLDEPFKVQMTAAYYAGGRVAEQPVEWRVTQFPYTWTPQKREGFYYSTDARFSGYARFRSTPARQVQGTTDIQGGDVITLDPGIEPTAQPRRYVIESTVTGADDQTVSNTHQVLALPPFVLGLKVPRFQDNADLLYPEVIVADARGDLLAGQQVVVRLLRRQWHSYLKAGDFTQGVAKYVTETVDEQISETPFTSKTGVEKLSFSLPGAGVYIVQVESSDLLGRSQMVSVDLFAGGKEPVTWSKPAAKTFTVTAEKKSYAPGETAKLVLESPFQNARAIAVVEIPGDRNRYEWVDIKNGTGVFTLDIDREFIPAIPVHFLLMRGRVGKAPESPVQPDLGKPATLAASVWVTVKTNEHRVLVDLAHPDKAQPGDRIDVTINLTDNDEKPIAGEVTLWLVDQAALALGTEQRLDPLPDFIVHRDSRITIRDVRNQVQGYLPFMEEPGGDAPDMMEARMAAPADLLDRVTIRKNFSPVPYFNPAIIIGRSGTAVVQVQLPDNLTRFKIRAKAVSGPDRFGFGKGEVAVRLPVIVQPSLPRFVRPGDRFSAVAIGRVVEGEGGDGKSEMRAEGLELQTAGQQSFQWDPGRANRIEYEVRVLPQTITPGGGLDRDTVRITVGVERTADAARDAFSVELPIRPDRRPVREQKLAGLAGDETLIIPAVTETVRPGSLKRSLLISGQPGLVRMAAGLDYLYQYPHGCTEQRISRARAFLAAKKFRTLLADNDNDARIDKVVNDTLAWLDSVMDANGLTAYWPGSTGYVSLTAWTLQFMVEAGDAGYPVNEQLMAEASRSLKQALRSDYAHHIFGEAYADRCWSLIALADAGLLDKGYAAELSRKSEFLSLESLAHVTQALARSGEAGGDVMEGLRERLFKGLVFRLHQGEKIYGGLQKSVSIYNALVLPSETRTISEVLRAVARMNNGSRDQDLLARALVTLGQGDGWGSTNANAAALLALTDHYRQESADGTPKTIEEFTGGTKRTIELSSGNDLKQTIYTDAHEISLKLLNSRPEDRLAVRSDIRYLPGDDGSHAASRTNGFVVRSEILRVADEGKPFVREKIDTPGSELGFGVGDIVETHVELVNPEDRHYVAVVVPLAAGMEPMNPNLATAAAESRPKGVLTRAPDYVAYMDDQMAFYYNQLPKGIYHFYFRTRAVIPGQYIQPPAYAEMMYKQAVNGQGNGVKVVIESKAGE